MDQVLLKKLFRQPKRQLSCFVFLLHRHYSILPGNVSVDKKKFLVLGQKAQFLRKIAQSCANLSLFTFLSCYLKKQPAAAELSCCSRSNLGCCRQRLYAQTLAQPGGMVNPEHFQSCTEGIHQVHQ
jgi:hypothetical protein